MSCSAPVTDSWDELADWWIDAVRDDPSQSADTHDVLVELLVGTEGPTAEIGCGEGQGMRTVGGSVVGIDLSYELLRTARSAGPVVVGRAPDLAFLRSGVFRRVVAVGLLDLIDDHETFLREAHRVARPAGHLCVVINHPIATAPASAPLVDPTGEVLWRWGTYLTPGVLPQRIDGHTVDLIHRPVGDLLTSAARAGWSLEQMIERGPSLATLARHPDMTGQEQIPTLAGFRWRRD